jgi:hypothetical protein
MVEPDGGCGDKPYPTATEQLLVATGTGADNQGIGIVHQFGRERPSGQEHQLVGQVANGFLDIRYLIVYYYFHGLKKKQKLIKPKRR